MLRDLENQRDSKNEVLFECIQTSCGQEHDTDCYNPSILCTNLMVTAKQKCTTDTQKNQSPAEHYSHPQITRK